MQVISQPETHLYRTAAAMLAKSIAETCAQQGYCILGIVGGRSIPTLLEHLTSHNAELHGTIHVFWLDERIGTEKNYISALPALERLHHQVDIHWYPLQSLHVPSMEVEARQAVQTVERVAGSLRFDIVVLSAGEDGHIASLFPNHATLDIAHSGYVIEEHAPKPPALRITATLPLLLSAKEGFLFITGEKQESYQRFFDPAVAPHACPAKFLLGLPRCTLLTTIVESSAKHL